MAVPAAGAPEPRGGSLVRLGRDPQVRPDPITAPLGFYARKIKSVADLTDGAESPKGPYANIIAVRRGDKDKPWAQQLVKAYHSPEVRSFIETRFNGALVPAF